MSEVKEFLQAELSEVRAKIEALEAAAGAEGDKLVAALKNVVQELEAKLRGVDKN